MNQKELGEIRRRIRPEHNAIHHIYGCYVNTNKEIVSSLEESLGLLTQEETEKYFSLLKKTLSGALGKNLLDISFATKQVMDSEEHRLLTALRKSELADAALREEFYRCIIDHVDMEDQNYLILMAYDVYDVPHYGKDGQEDDRGDVYKYMLCCICPVKPGKPELGYVADEKRFRSSIIGQVVAAPELGFLFPAFDGRATNIYNALFYSKNINASHQDFVDAVFRTPVPMSAGRQKESFNEALTGALDKDCSFDVVQAMHEQLNERIAVYKETKDPEPMTVTLEEMDALNLGLFDLSPYSGMERLMEYGSDAHLNGNQATAYARIRRIDSDYKRVERGRYVLTLLARRIQKETPDTIVGVVMGMLGCVETNLDMTQLMTIAAVGLDVDLDHIAEFRVPAEDTYQSGTYTFGKQRVWCIRPDFTTNARLLHEFIYGAAGQTGN